MTALEQKQSFLAEKSIAVVGVSRNPKSFGNLAFKVLKEQGYRVFPINAQADQVEGQRCFHSLQELPERPGAVLSVVPPAETENVAAECARLGIKHLWMQQGAESGKAEQICREGGVEAVSHACVLMYAHPRGIHSFHRFFKKTFGTL
jgi:predicted CoA-binding protein